MASTAALTSPDTAEHALVLATRLALEAATTIEHGIVRLPAGCRAVDLRVTREGVPRALTLLPQIINVVQKAGGLVEIIRSTVDGGRYESRVVLDGEHVPFSIEEEVRREDPPQPPSNDWLDPSGYRPRGRRGRLMWPHSTFHSTGKLILKLHGLQGTGARQNLVDRPSSGRLEVRLEELAGAFREAAAAVKTRREATARRERENEEHRRKRAEAERESREDQELVQQMFQMKRHWAAAQELRTFIAAIEATAPERTPVLDGWLGRARGYADAIEPLTTPEKAERLLLKYDTRTWYSEAVIGTGKKTTIW